MTIDEIVGQITQRMITGLMVHSQMCDYYSFLGLKGYAKCHLYHFYEENNNYKKFSNYYIRHYDKLVLDLPVANPKVIPDDWYRYTRQDVDVTIRSTSIQAGFEKWVKWEKETKAFYEQQYRNLMDMGYISMAIEVKKYVKDVDFEFADATQKMLSLKAINYDISDIIMEQDELHKKYCKKIKEIELCYD